MNLNKDIQQELSELNSILAEFPRANVYNVPEGYFETIIPDVFLSVFPNQISISPDHNIPSQYFDVLADEILNKIRSGASPETEYQPLSLAGVKSINVYRVPSDYFKNLPASITDKIKTTAEGITSEILSEATTINVYHAPVNYFNELPGLILSKISPSAKVIEMKRSVSIFKYAAAAVISGLIGLSVLSVFDNKETRQSIPPASGIMAQADKIMKTNSFEDVLSTVDDNDIVNYLQKNGEDVNAALVASVTEDKNLPEEIDYLTDDKTLDNLLNGLTTSQSQTN